MPHGVSDIEGTFDPASSDEEVEVLDSVSKIDSALQEQLSPTSEESGNMSTEGGNQSEDGEDVEQLRRVNEQLRNEVADLTSALLARDLELVRLRERCQFLTTAVEQQDEVIAKIYTTAANEATKVSVVTALPVPTLGSSLGSRNCNRSEQSEKKTSFGSMKNYPDVDVTIKKKKSDTDPIDVDMVDEDSLTYGEFLQRISLPASRDILDKIRMFVGSILGPRGDGQPPRSSDYVEYDFYGKHEFRRRCNRFFRSMEDVLLDHPAWRHVSEAKLTKARDGIEKYVMDKVSDIAFNQLKECQKWMEEDEALLRRMQLLSVRYVDFNAAIVGTNGFRSCI
ncbi:Hypothetical protein PHPALM_15719 [Phytophthora palmivora]|uniref:RABX5 catalytic core helical domain-containing protein n=1 Tax=Phytophthora palmivora TaxID=4796 RepID=A0A2P4XRH1_9STRA|nr:Hypothetical protein PHPALM_15719 [Phytophthora palmivora]